MNSLSLGSFILKSPSLCKFHPLLQTKHQPVLHTLRNAPFLSPLSLSSKPTFLRATDSANVDTPDGTASFVPIPEIIEKDWSVLDCGEAGLEGEFKRNFERIISAGKVEDSSKVLVSTGSEGFVDCLVGLAPSKSLFVVHDSLFILAFVKEKHDNVRCLQGEILHIPENWAPFDVVFLYFLPALPFKLDDILGSLAKNCSPGARVIISHPKGRQVLEQQRQQYPEVVVSDLPDKTYLQSVAASNSFDLVEFFDEPGLYLAVLISSKA